MPIPVITNFDVNTTSPIDSRLVVESTTERNNILYKYHGLKVFQRDNNTSWVWAKSGDSFTWSREGSGIYGGSGSLIGNTDVNIGGLSASLSSVSNRLSWTSTSGRVDHYLIRHSETSDVTSYSTSLYSIEYNSNGSLKGPYIRFNRIDSEFGGLGFGVGLTEDDRIESLVLRGNGQVGIRTQPNTDFQVGPSTLFAPITNNVGTTFSAIGFNWFPNSKYNNSNPAANLYLDNNGTFFIRTSSSGTSTFTNRLTIETNQVTIPGIVNLNSLNINSPGSNRQLSMSTSSVVYSTTSSTSNIGGEIRYETIQGFNFGGFVVNSGWQTTSLSGKRDIINFIGGSRLGINRLKITSSGNGLFQGRPTIGIEIDTLNDRHNNSTGNPQWEWRGVSQSLGTSLEFNLTDSPNSSFIFRGASLSFGNDQLGTFSNNITGNGGREILKLQHNAVRLGPGRVLSFSLARPNTLNSSHPSPPDQILSTQSAAGSIQMTSGMATITNHVLISNTQSGVDICVLFSPRSNAGSPGAVTSNNKWGHLTYWISRTSGILFFKSSNNEDDRIIDWVIYYRDASIRDLPIF